jgi:hypothetical protein
MMRFVRAFPLTLIGAAFMLGGSLAQPAQDRIATGWGQCNVGLSVALAENEQLKARVAALEKQLAKPE